MNNIYYSPGDFGLESIGEIDWSDGCYQFDLTVVWRRVSDGVFVYDDDSGCSCPSPFEVLHLVELTPIESLAEFQAYLKSREAQARLRGEERASEIAALLERLHQAGVR